MRRALSIAAVPLGLFLVASSVAIGQSGPAAVVGEETFTCPTELTIHPVSAQEVVIRCAPAPTATATPSPTPIPTASPTPSPTSTPTGGDDFILMGRAELMALPTSGAAWNAVVSAANALGPIDLSNQDEQDDVRLLAAALVAVRTGGSTATINSRLAAVPNTENGGETLALGRNLLPVILAADLVGYRAPAFVSWLSGVRNETLSGRTLISTHDDRPNNWGTMAGASRIAADLYLGDTTDLAAATRTFRGWLGDRSQYADFNWTSPMSWHANQSQPVGINPVGATIQGRNVDGVLPDDQRRAGGFSWPPPCENYVWEALQGALMQAELLHQAGQASYQWSNGAIGRAYAFLDRNGCRALGDDTWQPHLVNARLGTAYQALIPSQHGKNMGFADWLYR